MVKQKGSMEAIYTRLGMHTQRISFHVQARQRQQTGQTGGKAQQQQKDASSARTQADQHT
jgi:hypothetical protein